MKKYNLVFIGCGAICTQIINHLNSYMAEKYDQDTLSYRVYAKFDNAEQENNLRIGLQGTAKIYGERVSLFFYLFRKPISYVRQFLGI